MPTPREQAEKTGSKLGGDGKAPSPDEYEGRYKPNHEGAVNAGGAPADEPAPFNVGTPSAG